jgi:hypothetical protein
MELPPFCLSTQASARTFDLSTDAKSDARSESIRSASNSIERLTTRELRQKLTKAGRFEEGGLPSSLIDLPPTG